MAFGKWLEYRASFNSRSRKGSDHRCIAVKCFQVGFNSRSRKGSDNEAGIVVTDVIKFQFTLP